MRHRAFGRLQFRLLAWFLGAIVLALAASGLTTLLTSSESENPTRIVSRHVIHRAAKVWDDPVATEAYLARLREDTGLDIRARRDLTSFESRRGRMRPNGVFFEDGMTYVPVVRNGAMIGALELRSGFSAPQPWRVAAALGAALVALGLVARRVSKRLARPLEHLAETARRFGKGELAARTGIDRVPRRWVAEEVRDLAVAFDDMATRIERVLLDQRELLAAISHELRSPLGRARIALEIARDRAGGPSAGSLDDVERQLVEVDAILGDLLASARAGLADARLAETNLAAWLRERLASEEIPTRLEVDREDVTVALDGALLGRAVHNILANAHAHGHPAEQPVVVALRTSGERVVVTFTDAGPGFAPDVLPRAFDPFVSGKDRARTPSRAAGGAPSAAGLGLGLALVRRIVEAHGGSVSARNAAVGAEITVELPRVVAAGLAPVRAEA